MLIWHELSRAKRCCAHAQPPCEEEAAPWLEVITDRLLGQKKPAQPKELQTVKNNPTKAFWKWYEELFQPLQLFSTSAKVWCWRKVGEKVPVYYNFHLHPLAVPGRGAYCENLSLKLKLISQEPPYLSSLL